MSKEEPAWKAELRPQIRAVMAEADGFQFEWLESHDYQRPAGAILNLLEVHIRAAEQRGFQAGVNKTGDSVGRLRKELKTARADALREMATQLRRTPRDSRDYPSCLTGARLIEDALDKP